MTSVRRPRFRVALTFDAEHPDRPTDPGVHERVVETLDRRDVSATFFVQGRWAEAYPDLAAALPRLGHLVASHSFYHVRAPLLSPSGLATDVRRAEQTIRSIAGVDPRPWFRLPFGSGASSPVVGAILDRLGYRHVPWHADGREWRRRVNAQEVERAIVAQAVEHGDGAIVLLHSWPRPVPDVLIGVIDRLRDAGAELVRVDRLPAFTELAGVPAVHEARSG